MANPNVRPHLKFFPEDANGFMSDAVHGSRWMHELDTDLLTPMVRHNEQDFFVLEPSAIIDQTICMPFRWFTKSDQIFAQAWKMKQVSDGPTFGWHVVQYEVFEIPLSEFISSFPYLIKTSYHRNPEIKALILPRIISRNG